MTFFFTVAYCFFALMALDKIFFVSVIFSYKCLSEDILHSKFKPTQQYHVSSDTATVKPKRLEMEVEISCGNSDD